MSCAETQSNTKQSNSHRSEGQKQPGGRSGSMGCVISLPVLACAIAATASLLYLYKFESSTIRRLLRKRNLLTVSANQAVFITGCDSGLGYSFALHAHKLGFTVLAGCLHPEGDGGKQLLQSCPERLHVLGLDVTSGSSVRAALKAVENILARDQLLGRQQYPS
jgi:hypothetical protein